MAWDVLSGAAKMAWDVLSGVTKTAWDVLSGVANRCGMFCPGCQKMAWDVLSYIRVQTTIVVNGGKGVKCDRFHSTIHLKLLRDLIGTCIVFFFVCRIQFSRGLTQRNLGKFFRR